LHYPGAGGIIRGMTPSASESEVQRATALLVAVMRNLQVPGILERRGLSASQVILLFTLQEQSGEGVPLGELARQMGVPRSTMTSIADRLERDGIVSRATTASDRRVVLLRLTPRGRARINSTMRSFAQLVARGVEGMSRENLERLLAGLEDLRRLSGDLAREQRAAGPRRRRPKAGGASPR